MPEVSFGTKGSAEVVAAQQAINKAAEEGAEAFEELGSAAEEAGKDIQQQAKKGEDAQEKLTKTVKQTREEYKKNLEEQRRIGRLAEQITKRNETAQERYNRILKDTQAAMKANAISADVYSREVTRLNTEMKNSEGRFKSFAQQQEQSFGKQALGQLKSYAVGVLSVGTAVQAITSELRMQQEMVDRAASAKTTVSESRNIVIRNTDNANVAGQVLAENSALATKLGISEVPVNLARASALSATGGDIQASLAAVDIASQFLKDSPTAIPQFAGSLTDLAKVTGTNDALTNLGLLKKVGELSRVVDSNAQAQNIPRALIGMRAMGATTAEASAAFAALTSASADLQGATSGTAGISLAEQLRSFMPEAASMGAAISALQADPEKAKAFLADASFEKIALGPIEQLLLNPNSEAAKAYRANLAAVPDNTGLRAKGQESLDAFSINELNQTEQRKRGLRAFGESEGVASPDLLSADELAIVKEGLVRGGLTGIGASAKFAIPSLDGVTVDEAVKVIEQVRQERAGDVQAQREAVDGAGFLTEGGRERQREFLDNSRKQLDALDRLLDAVKETNRNLEDAGLVGVAQ